MDKNQEKDKKRFRLLRVILIAVLLVVLFGSGGFYASHFQGGLSSDHSRWSQFGDFFNGVVSPIFAAINIYIFWYLTKVIDFNNDKRQEQNAKHEKEILVMQFRKAEIERFEDIVSTALMPTVDMSKSYLYLHSIALAINYTDSFVNYRLELFNLDYDSDIVAQIKEINSKLREFFKWVDEKEEYPERRITSSIYYMKSSITSKLYKITLGENT